MTTDLKQTIRELRESLESMLWAEKAVYSDSKTRAVKSDERIVYIAAKAFLEQKAVEALPMLLDAAEKAERYEKALREIAATPYRIYDGNRPFVSDHDSGYAMGVADGHRLAAKWADEALAPEQPKEEPMIDSELMNEIREAADKGKTSLHEGEVCKTCGGSGMLNNATGQRCHNCNGTGKAVK